MGQLISVRILCTISTPNEFAMTNDCFSKGLLMEEVEVEVEVEELELEPGQNSLLLSSSGSFLFSPLEEFWGHCCHRSWEVE